MEAWSIHLINYKHKPPLVSLWYDSFCYGINLKGMLLDSKKKNEIENKKSRKAEDIDVVKKPWWRFF